MMKKVNNSDFCPLDGFDVEISTRFFSALDALAEDGKIRGRQTFTRACNIDRRNFYKQEVDITRKILRPSWLKMLVRDFGVSARWLLMGEGRMFS